jgi:signal peptidase I
LIKKEKSNLRENIEAILIAIVIAMFIRSFIVQAFKIPSGSMENTLLIGDHILVNKFIYGVKLPITNQTLIPFKTPKNGEIVVFTFELEADKKDFIKRVIGIAGDTIEIKDKKLFVNGKITEAYPAVFTDDSVYPENVNPRDNFGPVTVPENALFVMGDNRDNSYDSRFWGFVSLKSVKGRAFMIYWSWDSTKFGVRWSRIGDAIK